MNILCYIFQKIYVQNLTSKIFIFIIRTSFIFDHFLTRVEILHTFPLIPSHFEWRHDCPTLIEFIKLEKV